jgi:hypothetical protein
LLISPAVFENGRDSIAIVMARRPLKAKMQVGPSGASLSETSDAPTIA